MDLTKRPAIVDPQFKLRMFWQFGSTMKDIEKYVIIQTLRALNWNRSQTAKSLGISDRNLRGKIYQYRKDGCFIPNSPYQSYFQTYKPFTK